jgi:triphosphatase
MTEVELKLACAPENLAKLKRTSLLRALGRGKTVPVYSVYYDTPEASLKQNGVAFRMRRLGSRWLQTVKSDGRVSAGLHERAEWETPCPEASPNWDAAEQTGVPLFADPQLRARLIPVFVTEFRRTIRTLGAGSGDEIELCLDQGEIRAGGAREPISEVELELRSGALASVYELALELQEIVPLRVENRSKAERGYALLSPQLGPVKAEAPALTSDMTVASAFQAICWSAISQLQANERGMLESEDVEYLHQMRVAGRRLRAALSIFGKALPPGAASPAVQEVKWLGGALGPARDWDVFATQTLPPMREAFPGQLDALAEAAASARARAREQAREAVASPRFARLLLMLSAWLGVKSWHDRGNPFQLDSPAARFSLEWLGKHHRKVRKRGEHLAQLAPQERHQLRIAIKRLRYGADFFSSLYPAKRTAKYLSALAELQDVLGALNDATVAREFAEELCGLGAPAESTGIVQGYAAGKTVQTAPRLERAWERFEQKKIFW